jgi:membrane-associated protease RseP (regulator of RpoE activity)
VSDQRAAPPPRRRKPLHPWVNVVLFVLTLFTTFATGATGMTAEEQVHNGLIFMASLMGILLFHEMGHYIMAKKNKVPVSLPFFIPFPPYVSITGTMGAVIVMRGRIKSRNALLEVGVAGPLAGVALAIPLLAIGLARCAIEPLPPGGFVLGDSLLLLFLGHLVVGPIPPGHDVMLGPMAMAGWIGLFVTMLNLIPIGQLDGGHIFYAMFGDLHIKASRLFFKGLFALGAGIMAYNAYTGFRLGLEGEMFIAHVMPGVNWIFLGFLLFIFMRKRGLGHPPTDDTQISKAHRIAGYICIALFILTFMPIPIRPIL